MKRRHKHALPDVSESDVMPTEHESVLTQHSELIDEIKDRWEIDKVAVAHRTGRVDIGELSLVIAVSAAHRRPAFEATLHFIDRLKEVVPIWKKEYFEGGEVWIGDPGSEQATA